MSGRPRSVLRYDVESDARPVGPEGDEGEKVERVGNVRPGALDLRRRALRLGQAARFVPSCSRNILEAHVSANSHKATFDRLAPRIDFPPSIH